MVKVIGQSINGLQLNKSPDNCVKPRTPTLKTKMSENGKRQESFRNGMLQPPNPFPVKEKADISAGLSREAPLNAQSCNYMTSCFQLSQRPACETETVLSKPAAVARYRIRRNLKGIRQARSKPIQKVWEWQRAKPCRRSWRLRLCSI